MRLQSSAALRAIWKQIHPPLPLEPRQAQKLQSLLSTSFRKHLDSEHPQNDNAKARLTDAHIQRILASPLLHTRPGRAGAEDRNDGSSPVARLQASLCSPRETFEEQVSMGQATVGSATKFLKESRLRLRRDRKHWTAEEASGPSDTVLSWLWSSGLEDSMEFVYDYSFLDIMISFLVKSGKDETIWRWLSRLLTCHSGYDSSWEIGASNDAMQHLLRRYCYCTLSNTKRMDDSVAAILQASHRFGDQLQIKELVASCLKSLYFHLLVKAPSCTPLSQEVYKALTEDPKIWPSVDEESRAVMALLGPKFDPFPAYDFLTGQDIHVVERDPVHKRRRLLILSERTAEALSAVGEVDKANKLADRFSRRSLSLNDAPNTNHARPEAQSPANPISARRSTVRIDAYSLSST